MKDYKTTRLQDYKTTSYFSDVVMEFLEDKKRGAAKFKKLLPLACCLVVLIISLI